MLVCCSFCGSKTTGAGNVVSDIVLVQVDYPLGSKESKQQGFRDRFCSKSIEKGLQKVRLYRRMAQIIRGNEAFIN